MIGYAIAARRHRLPDEIPCVYRPFAESGEVFRWTDEVKANLEDYNRLDLSIWPPPNLPLEPRPASVSNRFTSFSRTTVCLVVQLPRILYFYSRNMEI